MRTAFAACAAATLAECGVQAQSVDDPWAGHWAQYEWLGTETNPEGTCTVARIAQRKYELHARGELITGVFGSVELRFPSNQECRFDGRVVPSPAFRALRGWGISGFSDVTGTRVQGVYMTCSFERCDDPSLSKESFTIGLSIEDGALVERHEADASRLRKFFPLSEFEPYRAELSAFIERYYDALRTGETEAVRPLLETRGLDPEQVEARLRAVPAFAERNRGIASIRVLASFVMDPSPPALNAGIERMAMVAIGEVHATGAVFPGVALFTQGAGGEWRLVP